jgi:hypothetical protein
MGGDGENSKALTRGALKSGRREAWQKPIERRDLWEKK